MHLALSGLENCFFHLCLGLFLDGLWVLSVQAPDPSCFIYWEFMAHFISWYILSLPLPVPLLFTFSLIDFCMSVFPRKFQII